MYPCIPKISPLPLSHLQKSGKYDIFRKSNMATNPRLQLLRPMQTLTTVTTDHTGEITGQTVQWMWRRKMLTNIKGLFICNCAKANMAAKPRDQFEHHSQT